MYLKRGEKLFMSIIDGKIKYCIPVYYSASKKLLSKIESIARYSLRLITGAVKNTPTATLSNEVNIPFLEERFLKLSFNYFRKVNTNQNHHIFKACLANHTFSFKNWKPYYSPDNVKLTSLVDNIGVPRILIFFLPDSDLLPITQIIP